MQYSHLPVPESQITMQHNPPVKLDFPSFSNGQDEDPVVFIERCEEYFAVRPLSVSEIMASLTAVLQGTAKTGGMLNVGLCKIGNSLKKLFCSHF